MVARWGWGSGLLPVFMAFLANIRPHSSIVLFLYPQSERLGVYLSLPERALCPHVQQSVVIERGATAVEVANAVT